MANHSFDTGALRVATRRVAPFIWILFALSAVMIGVGALISKDWMVGPILRMLGESVAGFALVFTALWALFRLDRSVRVRIFRAYFEGSVDNAFLTDSSGNIRWANANGRRFGATTMTGLLADLVADPDQRVARAITKVQQNGRSRDEFGNKQGRYSLTAGLMFDRCMLWTLRELGDNVYVARSAEDLKVPMFTLGRGGAILFMNEACRSYLGARPKSLDSLLRDLPLRPGQVHRLLLGPENTQARIYTADAGEDGRTEVFLFPEVPDPTQQITQPEGGWQFFDALPVPLLKIAPDGRIALSNKLARDLLEDPIDKDTPASDLLEGLGRPISDWIKDAAEGRGLQHPEFLRTSRAQSEKFIQVHLNRVIDGDQVYMVAVLNDATELKTLEAQFVQSQKMQAIGQLAGGVAHDFNNLLTAISGHCDLLLLRHDQSDPEYADLIQINQNANRAAALVGQLLAFSRKQNLRPETVDLRDTLSDLTHLLNRLVGERVSLQLTHDPSLPPIRADKRQLEQVVMNLVVNARDAMPSGGEICVWTEVRELTEPLRRDRAVVPPGRYVMIGVEDQGIGITPDKLHKIFEPFFTTKRQGEGTGLGLSTAYGIVKQSGGFIFADSEVDVGTRFTLLFPTYEEDAHKKAPVAPAPSKAQPAAGGGVILLVEDEAPVRAFASRALRLRGYTVIEAESAENALEILSDTDQDFDLFVTDVIMPGMDGPTWVRQARQTRPDIKVIFVSGYAEEAFSDHQAAIPNSVFLPKPFSLNDLTATVQQQLDPEAGSAHS